MIQDDEDNPLQEPLPLGTFIYIMGWMGTTALTLVGVWVIYQLARYGVCTYTLIVIISLAIMVLLLEKLKLPPAQKEAVSDDSDHQRSTSRQWIFYLAMLPFALAMLGFVLYLGLIFISAFFQFVLEAPVLMVMILTVTPTIVLILNWLMGLSFWSKGWQKEQTG